MANIACEMFSRYTEPVATSFSCGELVTTTFMVHRNGTYDNDWLANVKLKNTLTISVLRCVVYLDDIMNLCRKCKMYLVTDEVFRVAVTYAMLHPLYQTQYMDFSTDVNTDYDSMMAGAGKVSYEFMRDHFKFKSGFERTVLEILRYYSMTFINNFKYKDKDKSFIERLEEVVKDYDNYMKANHHEAYRTSKRFKAQTYLVNEDGFIILEPQTRGKCF